MALPGSPASQVPTGRDHLVREIADLKRALRELGPSIANSFAPVIADLQAQQADLTAQQADLTAAVADIADLSANQVTGAIGPAATASSWPGTTSWVTKASTTIAVPAGYTQAIVTALAMVVFYDPSINSFYARCVVAGTAGPQIYTLANTTGSASPSQTRTLSGLSGGTLTLEVQVMSGMASAAQAANQAVITGSAIFLK